MIKEKYRMSKVLFCIYIDFRYICLENLNNTFKTYIMSTRYTKADLEQIVCVQLENLNAMHDLISIMKDQNELLNSANKKLKDEITNFKQKIYPTRKRNS